MLVVVLSPPTPSGTRQATWSKARVPTRRPKLTLGAAGTVVRSHGLHQRLRLPAGLRVRLRREDVQHEHHGDVRRRTANTIVTGASVAYDGSTAVLDRLLGYAVTRARAADYVLVFDGSFVDRHHRRRERAAQPRSTDGSRSPHRPRRTRTRSAPTSAGHRPGRREQRRLRQLRAVLHEHPEEHDPRHPRPLHGSRPRHDRLGHGRLMGRRSRSLTMPTTQPSRPGSAGRLAPAARLPARLRTTSRAGVIEGRIGTVSGTSVSAAPRSPSSTTRRWTCAAKMPRRSSTAGSSSRDGITPDAVPIDPFLLVWTTSQWT